MLNAQTLSSSMLQPLLLLRTLLCLWQSYCMQCINHWGTWCQELGNSFTNICAIKDQEIKIEL